MLNYPQPAHCRCVYRMIQAHCAVRTSTRVGSALRSFVGATGDIAGIPHTAIEAKFDGRDIGEAQRLIALAQHNKRRSRHDG